jgi:hypothetical protein
MTKQREFEVIQLDKLNWPTSLKIPSKRYRLFVAADSQEESVKVISDFAAAALNCGMVSFCSWGPGCERFHDIVDEVIVQDDLGERRFAGPNPHDTVMTTWHQRDTLEEALDYFATLSKPTSGFLADSAFWLVMSVRNAEWALLAARVLERAEFSD